MKELHLPKSCTTAEINVLDESAISDVLALQDKTRASLPEDKKRFMLPKGTAFFQNLLTGMTGSMIGIRSEGHLIAQMAIVGPIELREAIALHYITRNDIVFHHATLTDSVVVFKGLASDPDWRGNDLAKSLLTYALELPLTQVAHHIFAQISVGNKRCWDVFLREKFGIVGAGVDPEDAMPRFVFQKPSFGFDFAATVIADEVDPAEDFPAIIALTQREGLIGIYENHSSDKLCFLRSHEGHSLMPVVAKVNSRR